MLSQPFSFDDLMAPLGADTFFAEYEGQKPLHLKGHADKFVEVMTWAKLSDILSLATIWSQNTLRLVLDKEPIAASKYCKPAIGRDCGRVLRPDPDQVAQYLKHGATLIASDIDHLGRGITEFSKMLEGALEGV